jgi:ATP synthase protein I
MEKRKQPSSLNDIEARLRAARDRELEHSGDRGPRPNTSGLGMAWRITVELVVSVMVGAGIGYALDSWLGSAPWLMMLFLLLGGAAGVMNAYRAAKGMDSSVGLGAAQRRARERDESEGS